VLIPAECFILRDKNLAETSFLLEEVFLFPKGNGKNDFLEKQKEGGLLWPGNMQEKKDDPCIG